ncbi:hypothetical protein [Bradyrhizobium sp. Y-H1]|uniref:hypothetical protein n=2 Tax=unclassified Bradyrhizobium TaxID=2631580 RepID=UPI001045C1BE|nr:hypothetical protein [Bradyrhizobium sp. Y-H1]
MLNPSSQDPFETRAESAYPFDPSAKDLMAKRILEGLGKQPGAGRVPRTTARRGARGRRVHISKADENIIRTIIEEWSRPEMGWEDVVEAVEQRLGRNWTRQALGSHSKIKLAFQHKKEELKNAKLGRKLRRSRVDADYQRMAKFTQDIGEVVEGLRKRIEILEARFARWRHNAYLHRLTVEQLDAPLQENDRGRTD